MKIIRNTAPLLAVFALAGCSSSTEQSTSGDDTSKVRQQQTLSPEEMTRRGFQQVSYSASGKTYVVYYQRDRLARADKVVTQVTKGTPFTATTSDDVEVQNMLRDAYRAHGLCAEGLHPGLINLGYGPFMAGGTPSWSAYIRCSDKLQANL